MLTVRETRKKLGALVCDIFTEDFAKKYELINEMNIDEITVLMDQKTCDVDLYVCQIANNLDDLFKLKSINSEVNSDIVIAFFMRYHLLTCYLAKLDQKSFIDLPGHDKEFLVELLINYWKKSLY